jgi:hypothetical protein
MKERFYFETEPIEQESGLFDTELAEFEEELRRAPMPVRGSGLRPTPVRPHRPHAPRPPTRPPLVIRRPRPVAIVGEPRVCECPPQGTDYVRWVQDSHNRILSLRLPVDGVMGPETRSAIRTFQRREGLPVTGIVGPDTERALIAAIGSTRQGEMGGPEFFGTEAAEFVEEAEVKRDSPEYIGWVQRSLNRIMGLRLAVDSRIGPGTRNAIRTFQRQRGLKVDGIVGPQTEQALIAAGGEPQPSGTTTSSTVQPTGLPGTAGSLGDLKPLIQPSTAPTVENALNIMRIISLYHSIPWKICYTILEHEGGVRIVRHPDGVMQTTNPVRRSMIPRIPRALKLVLLGLPPNDGAPDSILADRLRSEFSRRLAVQIATGVQELKEDLLKFSGYVALAYQAYNAGAGWGYWTATRGRQKSRPQGVSDLEWENMCRFGASLLHQPATDLHIQAGTWQCDANIPAWFSHIPVYDRHTGLQLIAFKYLRSITQCTRKKPNTPCAQASHKNRDPGSGSEVCTKSRPGSLDKLYNPKLLRTKYYQAAKEELIAIQDDRLPLKVVNGRLVKIPSISSVNQEAWGYIV